MLFCSKDTSPDKVSFGVGVLDAEDEPRCKKAKVVTIALYHLYVCHFIFLL